HASATVLHWVDLARATAMEIEDHDQRRHDLQKCTEAEMIACDMITFRKGHPEQSTAPARKSYADPGRGTNVSDEVKRRQAIVAAVQSLREAAYHTQMAREQLTVLGNLGPAEAEMLEASLDGINYVACAHEPKRPGYAPQGETVGEAAHV
ncbi:MAG TPA: hypothetical protein VMQ93_08715, partial [Novosphingobium sp.]|nr:hypothetical protein [Novosphingobium sp.]